MLAVELDGLLLGRLGRDRRLAIACREDRRNISVNVVDDECSSRYAKGVAHRSGVKVRFGERSQPPRTGYRIAESRLVSGSHQEFLPFVGPTVPAVEAHVAMASRRRRHTSTRP